jgi:hypothetical protein
MVIKQINLWVTNETSNGKIAKRLYGHEASCVITGIPTFISHSSEFKGVVSKQSLGTEETLTTAKTGKHTDELPITKQMAHIAFALKQGSKRTTRYYPRHCGPKQADPNCACTPPRLQT